MSAQPPCAAVQLRRVLADCSWGQSLSCSEGPQVQWGCLFAVHKKWKVFGLPFIFKNFSLNRSKKIITTWFTVVVSRLIFGWPGRKKEGRGRISVRFSVPDPLPRYGRYCVTLCEPFQCLLWAWSSKPEASASACLIGRAAFGSCGQPGVLAWAASVPLSQGRARAQPSGLMHKSNCSSHFWTQMPATILGSEMVGSNATLYFCASDKSRRYAPLSLGWGLPSAASQSEALYSLGTVYIIVIKKPNMRACRMPYIKDFFYSILFHLERTVSPRK